jgi:mono/diheme cytochrome c family protein
MWRPAFFNLLLGLLLLSGCADSGSSAEPSGEMLYLRPHDDGNTFACATCHALEEPAPDGLRRPGHPVGDAANRPSYKNGQLAELRDAVNSCRVEWMAASELSVDDARWIALRDFLESEAGDQPAAALSYEIVQPPDDLSGGDDSAGMETFNQSCVVCHGVDATGTERGPALRGETLTEEIIGRRVRTSGAADSPIYPGLTNGIMPFWAADRLSDDELLDVTAFVLNNDGGGAGGTGGTGGDGDPELRECDATHDKIGQVATLSTLFHSVSGTAEIIDDCTIRVDDFTYDGGGIDVRFYSGQGGNYLSGFPMSDDLRRSGGYSGETVYAQLPEGQTLDALDGISVWCVDVASSFGDGIFEVRR